MAGTMSGVILKPRGEDLAMRGFTATNARDFPTFFYDGTYLLGVGALAFA